MIELNEKIRKLMSKNNSLKEEIKKSKNEPLESKPVAKKQNKRSVSLMNIIK